MQPRVRTLFFHFILTGLAISLSVTSSAHTRYRQVVDAPNNRPSKRSVQTHNGPFRPAVSYQHGKDLHLALTSDDVSQCGIRVCFTPEYNEGPRCTRLIEEAVDSARHTVLVQAYVFTSKPLARSLVNASRRGVNVRVILDQKEATRTSYTEANFLAHMGITPLLDGAHKIAHNKVMVIDSRLVITGSFNFTYSAEFRDAENVVFIDNPSIASLYVENFEHHAEHSTPFVEGMTPPHSHRYYHHYYRYNYPHYWW